MESGQSSFGSVASIGLQETRPSNTSMAAEDKHSLDTNREHTDCSLSRVAGERCVEGTVGDLLIEDEICAKTGAISNETKNCCRAFQQLESTGLSSQTEKSTSSTHIAFKHPLEEESLLKSRTKVVSTKVSGQSTFKESVSVTEAIVASCCSSLLISSNIQKPADVGLTASESKQGQTGINCVEKQVSAEICTPCDLESGRGATFLTDNESSEYNDDKVILSQQVLPVVERSSILEHEEKGKESEKHNSKCALQQEGNSTLVSSSSSYVPSSQKRVVIIQPLKGLVPEELCSSSSEGSQLKGSSEESYSILQGESAASEKVADVIFVPSSQNSHEFEPELPLPHVTPERSQHHCSLTESQLENLFENSISFDEVTTPPSIARVLYPIQEGYTKIKAKNVPQGETTPCRNLSGSQKCSSESSHSRRTVDQPCFMSSQEAEKESVAEKSGSEEDTSCKEITSNAKEAAVSSPCKNSVSHTLTSKQNIRVNTNVDFDVLFSRNTWNVSQTSTQELSVDLFEIDRRQSVKRKRSDTDDRSHKICPSDGNRQENKVLLRDSPVSPGEQAKQINKQTNKRTNKQTNKTAKTRSKQEHGQISRSGKVSFLSQAT